MSLKIALKLSDLAKQNSGEEQSVKPKSLTDQAKQNSQPAGAARQVQQNGVSQLPGRPTPQEAEQVILMQTIASALGVAMSSNKETVAKKLNMPVNDVYKISGTIMDTGGKKTFDGLWGNKTIRSLQELKKIGDLLGTKPITPGKNYKEVHTENVITAAKANIDAIAEIMKSLGFNDSIPGNVEIRPEYYDIVPQKLSVTNIRDFIPDGIAIIPTDLDNIWKFWDFLKAQDIGMFTKSSPEKAAREILSNSIVKLAQDPTAGGQASGAGQTVFQNRQQPGYNKHTEKTQVPIKNEEPSFEGLSPASFNAAMEWFARRARWIYQTVNQMFSSQETKFVDGKEVPSVTKQDFDAAKAYNDAMTKLYANWNAQKSKIFGKQDPSNTELSRDALKMWPDGKIPAGQEVGSAREISNESGISNAPKVRPVDGSGVEYEPAKAIVDKMPQGPLDTVIDLSKIYPFIQKESYARDWLMQNFAREDISISDFRRLYPQLLVDSYRINPNQNVRDFAYKSPLALQRVLNDAYTTWRSQMTLRLHDMPDSMRRSYMGVMDRQRNLLESWMAILTRMKSDAEKWHPGSTTRDL